MLCVCVGQKLSYGMCSIYIYTGMSPSQARNACQCVIGQITVSAEGARNDLTTLLLARGSQWHI